MVKGYIKPDGEIRFSTLEKQALGLIGNFVQTQPRKLKWFLRSWGVLIPREADHEELFDVVVDALSEKRPEFSRQLVELILWKPSDAFLPEDSQVNIGADPVSAIAGAVGSIADLIRASKQKKTLAEQSRNALLQQVLAGRNSASQPPTAPAKRAKGWKRYLPTISIAGLGLVLALFLLV